MHRCTVLERLAMPFSRAELGEFLRIAVEALARYRLRTALSVLGVVLGVAAVIAMMSVSEGAGRDALAQVEALGLDNLVARSTPTGGAWRGLVAGDADRAAAMVPLARAATPLLSRYVRLGGVERSQVGQVLGVRPVYRAILRLSLDRGRFLSSTDEQQMARVCVLGSTVARQMFGLRDPIGEHLRVAEDHYEVVGVLTPQGADPQAGGALSWVDINRAAFVPMTALTGRSLALLAGQPVDEVWLQVEDGSRSEELSQVFQRALETAHRADDFKLVIPRELLAQRYRTQRTFSIVVGSVAVLALLVGGIGIMNIMLTSVVERTREIGVRRTAGATRRDITMQFLVETLLMTLGGGAVGIVAGASGSLAIAWYAGWTTYVSPTAVGLGLAVSFLTGLVFGWYPALKAAALEPVDAMRYE